MSLAPFVSPGTISEASDWNTTKRPLLLIRGKIPFPAKVVTAVCRSRTKTPELLPGGPRLDELVDWNATNRPSSLTDGSRLSPFAGSPALLMLTLSVVAVSRSRRKISGHPEERPEDEDTTVVFGHPVSPTARLEASDSKTTKRPSLLREGLELLSLAWVPLLLRLTRVVVPVSRSCMKMSAQFSSNMLSLFLSQKLLASSGTRFVAKEAKRTKRPSSLRDGSRL